MAFRPDQTINTSVRAGNFLDWESEFDEATPASLIQFSLRTRKLRVLAAPVLPNWGLATAAGWVAYAVPGRRTALYAIRNNGTGRGELTDRLAAPVAGRGDRIAWGELAGRHFRVLVRDMRTGKEWLAADLPRCKLGRCYRLDYVSLASHGVVFTLGAVGAQPSYVVRRAFTARRPTYWRVVGDPQPDLAPSTDGALFYVSGRGWYRWDFTARTPTRTRFTNEAIGLRLELGSWVTSSTKECAPRYDVVNARGRRLAGLSWRTVVKASGLHPIGCGTLLALSVAARRVTSTWLYERDPGDDEAPVGLSVVSLVLSQSY